MCRVGNLDMIGHSPVFSGHCEISEIRRYAGIYFQPLESRLYPENILGNIYKSPGRGTGKPAVLSLAEIRSILSRYHLRVYIGFCPVDLADILQESRTDLPVYFKGSFPSAQNSF